jgi:hypothetical protein
VIINNTPAPMFRVGRRARSGQWRPATRHRRYDDAMVVAQGMVLGGIASETRVWQVGSGEPRIIARVESVKSFSGEPGIVTRAA